MVSDLARTTHKTGGDFCPTDIHADDVLVCCWLRHALRIEPRLYLHRWQGWHNAFTLTRTEFSSSLIMEREV
jgi:hypothetical protein